MAFNNPSGQYQQLYGNTYLQPPPQAPTYSRFSEQDYDNYQPYEDAELRRLEEKDTKLKRHIRLLRIISRTLAVILSIAVVVPLSLTVAKFLETRNTTHSGNNGEEEPIWPENTITTYTYIYFGVSVVSLLINAIVLASYWHGVRRANNVSTVGTVWTSVIIVGNLSVWIAAVAIYRYGKHKVDDKWRDIWGWTCSTTADDLQPFIGDIEFQKYCHIQDAGYYAGLLQVGASLLTLIIFVLMIMRRRSKKQLQSYNLDDAKEPLRR